MGASGDERECLFGDCDGENEGDADVITLGVLDTKSPRTYVTLIALAEGLNGCSGPGGRHRPIGVVVTSSTPPAPVLVHIALPVGKAPP